MMTSSPPQKNNTFVVWRSFHHLHDRRGIFGHESELKGPIPGIWLGHWRWGPGVIGGSALMNITSNGGNSDICLCLNPDFFWGDGMIQSDDKHIFQLGWFNQQLDHVMKMFRHNCFSFKGYHIRGWAFFGSKARLPSGLDRPTVILGDQFSTLKICSPKICLTWPTPLGGPMPCMEVTSLQC